MDLLKHRDTKKHAAAVNQAGGTPSSRPKQVVLGRRRAIERILLLLAGA